MPDFVSDKKISDAAIQKSVDALQVLEKNLRKWQKECGTLDKNSSKSSSFAE